METGAEAIKLTDDDSVILALLILFKMVTGFFKSLEDVMIVGFTLHGCSLKAGIVLNVLILFVRTMILKNL